MSSYASKAAYLKGLVEGMNFDKSKDETKVFGVIVDLLQELSLELENVKADCVENKELVYELDEDLGEVEKIVFECVGHGHNKNRNSACSGVDGGCDCSHGDYVDNGDYDEHDEYVDCEKTDSDDDSEKYEVLCPHCSQVINLENASLKENEIVCPKCGKELELDFGDDEDVDMGKTIDY